ncbi:MAG TPA: prepilin-type N-terminal cleavage/methylation domain-containing protein [Massilibacterium sp.]|nr:prepilin-type N-terminal cleavage/methylation domain-containing protein [Massilibacterium sp.]
MKRRSYNCVHSQKGSTLVEVLVVLVIVSIISVPMVVFTFDMMKSAIRTEEEIFLRDEADIILADFIDYLFIANEVQGYPESGNPKEGVKQTEVHIKTFEDKEYTLGFENGDAFVLEEGDKIILNNDDFKVDMDQSWIKVNEQKKVVHINLAMKSKKMKRTLELESSIGYIAMKPNE